VQDLLAADQEVRVVVRSADRLEPAVRQAVDVVEGSHSDPAVLGRAMEDVDALFWVVLRDPTASSLEDAYTGFSSAAITAKADGKVRRAVRVSALGRGTALAACAANVTASLALDDRIVESSEAREKNQTRG